MFDSTKRKSQDKHTLPTDQIEPINIINDCLIEENQNKHDVENNIGNELSETLEFTAIKESKNKENLILSKENVEV